MTSNLAQRLLVASVAIPVLLWLSYQGGLWVWGLSAVIGAVSLSEYLRDEQVPLFGLKFFLLQFFLLLHLLLTGQQLFWPFGDLGTFLPGLQFLLSFVPLSVILFVLLSVGACLEDGQATVRFSRLARVWWGFCYLSFLTPFLMLVSDFPQRHQWFGVESGDLLLLVFAIVWAGDSAAMWIGTRFGKRPLAPLISPNKSVEGFVAGIVAATGAAVAVGQLRLPEVGVGHAIGIGIFASISGQLGDLIESLWKRSAGVKDASQVIPGHGGMLDRFDSLLFAAPAVYIYLLLVFA